jgi:hypothetical protein
VQNYATRIFVGDQCDCFSSFCEAIAHKVEQTRRQMSKMPQPPPDAEVPAPGAAALRSRRLMIGMLGVGLGSMIYLGALAYREVQKQRIKADTEEARRNLRSMSLAFYEFETAYGAYPNASTAAEVKENTETILPLGAKFSNDIFRQLIAAEVCQSEAMFYAKIPGARKPDNVFIDAKTALVRGEVGYSCIAGLNSRSNPARPLVVTPLIPGTNKFDPKPFGGNAIILRVNSSGVNVLPINGNGEVIDSSGKHILDPANPIWGGETPQIVWPE